MACWDTRNGAKIGEDVKLTLPVGATEKFNGSGGELLAVTVAHITCLGGKFWQALDMNGCGNGPMRRVLWSVKTGREIVSWPVLVQRYTSHFNGENILTIGPFALALSSTGKYLAEGGAGRIQLYAVTQ